MENLIPTSGTLLLLLAAPVSAASQLILLIIVAAAFTIGYAVKKRGGPPPMVGRWADEKGFTILQSELRYISKGPFAWKMVYQGESVHRVRVQDSEGRERTAWLRCRAKTLFSKETIEVKWQDEL